MPRASAVPPCREQTRYALLLAMALPPRPFGCASLPFGCASLDEGSKWYALSFSRLAAQISRFQSQPWLGWNTRVPGDGHCCADPSNLVINAVVSFRPVASPMSMEREGYSLGILIFTSAFPYSRAFRILELSSAMVGRTSSSRFSATVLCADSLITSCQSWHSSRTHRTHVWRSTCFEA